MQGHHPGSNPIGAKSFYKTNSGHRKLKIPFAVDPHPHLESAEQKLAKS
jgi:hypothetical protein